KEIPVKIIYEDELCMAFYDHMPQAPVHFLMIPKKPIVSIATITEEDQSLLGYLMLKIKSVAQGLGLAEQGYRVVSNIGELGGQSVHHLHFHVLGARQMSWPPG